jgi:hypothetical protein
MSDHVVGEVTDHESTSSVMNFDGLPKEIIVMILYQNTDWR